MTKRSTMYTGTDHTWNARLPGRLLSNDIHVWRASLAPTEDEYGVCVGLLSQDELARAERMRKEVDRSRFVIAHGVLRSLIAFYVNRSARGIEFEIENKGRPILKRRTGEPDIRFSMSHSGAIGLFAFSLQRDVGVDVELIRSDIDVEQVSSRFFSGNEIRSLTLIPHAGRHKLFFQYWTRKEALIKGLGEGVSFPLENCDVSGMDGALSAFVFEDDEGRGSWFGADIFPGEGYCGAVGSKGGDWLLSCWNFSPASLKILQSCASLQR